MKKNINKIAQSAFFVVIGLIALGSFSTTFGETKQQKAQAKAAKAQAKAQVKAQKAQAKTEKNQAKSEKKAEKAQAKAQAKAEKKTAKAQAKADKAKKPKKKKHTGYIRTFNNHTPHPIAGTVNFLGGPACPSKYFAVASQQSIGMNSVGCLVKNIEISILPGMQLPKNTSKMTKAEMNNLIKSVNNPTNVSWQATKITAGTVAGGVAEGLGLDPFLGVTKNRPNPKGTSTATKAK